MSAESNPSLSINAQKHQLKLTEDRLRVYCLENSMMVNLYAIYTYLK